MRFPANLTPHFGHQVNRPALPFSIYRLRRMRVASFDAAFSFDTYCMSAAVH